MIKRNESQNIIHLASSTLSIVTSAMLIESIKQWRCRSLFAAYLYMSMSLGFVISMSPQIMDIVKPLNESRSRKLLVEVEYHVDQEKYYYPILFHSYVAVIATTSIIVHRHYIHSICATWLQFIRSHWVNAIF